MAPRSRLVAGLALILALGGLALLWQQRGVARPSAPAVGGPLPSVDAGPERSAATAQPPSLPIRVSASAPGVDAEVAEASFAAFQRVQVVHAATGECVPRATVLHVAPGFEWAALDAEAKDDYSLATERYLQRFGVSLVADDEGFVSIPRDAAQQAVAGRKGDLFGVGLERPEGANWTLRLSAHFTLTVEVFDAAGMPVPGVDILSEARYAINHFLRHVRLGTTDANGVVTRSFELAAPDAFPPKTQSVFAGLPEGRFGAFELDPAHPPRAPVRITLPATGTVTVLILDPAGQRLDPRVLADPNLIISVLDAGETRPRASAAPEPLSGRLAAIGADGCARFSNVSLRRTWAVQAPTLLGAPLVFRGPRADEVDVLVEHRMLADHPALVGRLIDPDGRPMPKTRFSIQCREGTRLLAMVGGLTDDAGRFMAYLTEQALGRQPDEITFGIDWIGAAPSRAAQVHARAPLLWKVEVGDVVMPGPR